MLSSSSSSLSPAERSTAGYLLKEKLLQPPYVANTGNSSKVSLQAPHDVTIKHCLEKSISSPDPSVRKAASSTISSCIAKGVLSMEGWGSLLELIASTLSMASSSMLNQQQEQQPPSPAFSGALLTLLKLSQDSPSSLDTETLSRPLNTLLPLTLSLFVHPSAEIRKQSIQTVTSYVPLFPNALVVNISQFISALGERGNDPDVGVREEVCRSLVSLVDFRGEYLTGVLSDIARFMVSAISDSSKSVVLAATEFWFALFTSETIVDGRFALVKNNLLESVVPSLLTNTVYGEEEIETFLSENEEERDNVNSKSDESNLAPLHAHHKNNKIDGDDSEEEWDDSDNSWTLRKCSAATIDAIGNTSPPQIFLPSILPHLSAGLAPTQQNPWVREASILVLGAIMSDNTSQLLEEHLPSLYPFLLTHLTENNLPQIRAITCWTLSRLAGWVVYMSADNRQPKMFQNLVESFLRMGMDTQYKRVQVAGLSAFLRVLPTGPHLIESFLDSIMQNLSAGLKTFRGRSLLVCYDCLSTMADVFGSDTASNDVPRLYLPTLSMHLQNSANGITNLLRSPPCNFALPVFKMALPLLECLALTFSAVGNAGAEWALSVYASSFAIVEAAVFYQGMSPAEGDCEEDYEFLLCTLDVIDGLVEGLEDNFVHLLASHGHKSLLPLLPQLASFPSSGVRMSTCAMIGDLAVHCPGVLSEGWGEIIKALVRCMREGGEQDKVCNNAIWAAGEMCKRAVDASHTIFVDSIVEVCGNYVINNDGNNDDNSSLPKSILSAAAVTLGRIAAGSPQRLSPLFSVNGGFVGLWCSALSMCNNVGEKVDGFLGVLKVLNVDLGGCLGGGGGGYGVSNVRGVVLAVASWHVRRDYDDGNEDEEDLREMDQGVLHGSQYLFGQFPNDTPILKAVGVNVNRLMEAVKTICGDNEWQNIKNRLPGNVVRMLKEEYRM